MSQKCQSCEKPADECQHTTPNFWAKCRALFQMCTLKPFILVVVLLFFMQFSALFAMRSYIVQVLRAHAIPMDANFCTTILGMIGVLANFGIVVLIRRLGKRRIYLYSQMGNILSCFGLCKAPSRTNFVLFLLEHFLCVENFLLSKLFCSLNDNIFDRHSFLCEENHDYYLIWGKKRKIHENSPFEFQLQAIMDLNISHLAGHH